MASQNPPEQAAQNNPGRGAGQRGMGNDESRQRPGGNGGSAHTQANTSQGTSQGTAMQANQGSQQRPAQQGMERRMARAVTRDPFEMIEQLSNEMDRMFQSFAFRPFSWRRGGEESSALRTMWSPEVDVHEEGNQLKVCVDLPGIPRENVKVDIEDGAITVQGERHEERTEGGEGQRVRRMERRYGSFYRTIPLPDEADVEQAKANMKDGVLEITLPITEKIQGRRLEIQG
jgi:HSP20 family protein